MTDTQDDLNPLQPAWRIVLKDKGKDLTDTIGERLLNLSITDHRGVDSDELSLELDDPLGDLAFPPTGAQLAVSIGWVGAPLVFKGLYTIDELEYEGDPGKLILRGRAAAVGKTLRIKKEKSWHGLTFGQIAQTIATAHGLTLVMSTRLLNIPLTHVDQTNESDINFLTRVAHRHDAIATVKADRLLITPTGRAHTVSDKPIPAIIIQRSDGDTYRYETSDREKYTGVRAYWHNPRLSRRTSVLAGTKTSIKYLRETWPSQDEARRAAQAELKRLQRGEAKLNFTLAQGLPELTPEVPVNTSGFKTEIDDTPWIVVTVTHHINDSGYTTAAELETRAKDA